MQAKKVSDRHVCFPAELLCLTRVAPNGAHTHTNSSYYFSYSRGNCTRNNVPSRLLGIVFEKRLLDPKLFSDDEIRIPHGDQW